MASLLAITEDGKTIEIGTVGNEGFIGVPIIHETDTAPYRVMMQVPASAMRIGAEALSIELASVVGPYASVNCTLSLLKSSIRTSPIVGGDGYARQVPEDEHFTDYAGSIQSIVTSTANNDSGLFETNLRDERFLPFEGAGAISTWILELPSEYRAFDYLTISDVMLHIRYTARPGVPRQFVAANLATLFDTGTLTNLALLFSLRHDFPTEWAAFVNGTGTDFTAKILQDYFPYFVQGKQIIITGLELYGEDVTKHHAVGSLPAVPINLSTQSQQSQFTITAPADSSGPTQVLTTASTDVFLIVRYSIQ